MVFSKEEFEDKINKLKISNNIPKLIDNIIDNDKVDAYINNLDISLSCKNALNSFKKTIKYLLDRSIPINKNILIVGNESIETIKLVVMSILVNANLSDNCLCDKDFSNPNLNCKYMVDYPLAGNGLILRRNIQTDTHNHDDTFYIFACSRIVYYTFIHDLLHLFPFVLEDSHDTKEKKSMVQNMCESFEIPLIDNVDIISDKIGYLTLKHKTYKMLIEKLFANDKKELQLSDLLEIEPKPESEDQDSNPNSNCSFDDIIGLMSVKKQVERMVAYMKKGENCISSKHMAFLGNPGTGKTTMARCLAKELYSLGVLKKMCLWKLTGVD